MFITPNDTEVREALRTIWQSYEPFYSHCWRGPGTCPDWYVIRYMRVEQLGVKCDVPSVDAHGVSNYAQPPRETLTLKSGDSEDCEILRVPLLRTAGIPKSEVFVVLATDDITTQAWLREANAPFEAGNIEPWYCHGFYNAVYYCIICGKQVVFCANTSNSGG